MELKRCLFGCLLALASVGSAAAMGVATQDPNAPHATIDSGSRDGGGAVGSASGTSHDCPPLPGPAGDGPGDADTGGGGGTATPHPRASHRSSLGWQSLLPGAIQ